MHIHLLAKLINFKPKLQLGIHKLIRAQWNAGLLYSEPQATKELVIWSVDKVHYLSFLEMASRFNIPVGYHFPYSSIVSPGRAQAAIEEGVSSECR